MIRKPVSSSSISSVGYDPKTLTLEVQFRSGEIYKYEEVPEDVYIGLMDAPSKGSYINDVVKNTYEFNKVG